MLALCFKCINAWDCITFADVVFFPSVGGFYKAVKWVGRRCIETRPCRPRPAALEAFSETGKAVMVTTESCLKLLPEAMAFFVVFIFTLYLIGGFSLLLLIYWVLRFIIA